MVKEELTTGRVAKMMGISVRTLRYYDQIGLLKPSATLSNGRRQYSKEDMLELEKNYHLEICSIFIGSYQDVKISIGYHQYH